MSMSKKDFIALADALRPVLEGPVMVHETGKPVKTIQGELVNALCAFMRGQNAQFKEGRWRAYLAGECGPSGGDLRKTPRKAVERWPGGGPVLPGDR